MPNLVRLVYVSEAAQPFTPADVAGLLQKSQRNNATRGVTGLLLLAGGHFMQVLEGSAEAVANRFEAIIADPRHRDIHPVFRESATDRLFGRWTMATLNFDAFAPFDRDQIRHLIDRPRNAAAVAADRSQIHKLLLNFSHQLMMAKRAA